MSDQRVIETKAAHSEVVTKTYNKPLTKGMLRVKVYTPFKTFYEGDARSLTAVNESGKFDVLPGHRNFITMLLPGEVQVESPEKEFKTIAIARGLMHVREDRLIIFLDV